MKVFALAPKEDWIVDRFVNEWNQDNADISTCDPRNADVVWLMADWCWTQVSFDLLRSKKVLTTIHHIVPDKFQAPQLYEFKARDELTDVYHVPNQYTYHFIRKLTQKPIHIIPYWANQNLWHVTSDKETLRKKHSIPNDAYVIGTFQRDTEGAGISNGIFLPKLEKGPDLLVDFVVNLNKSKKVHVVIGGWRRQFLITKLKEANVDHSYFELPTQSMLNELYQTLDLYPVTSRYEGGPQSLIECGLLNIPVVSRAIGMAQRVLSPKAINDDVSLAIPEVPEISSLKLPNGYQPYRKLIESICLK